MRAGKLDKVITLQRTTYVDDGYGGQIPVNEDFATMRAQLVQANTEEFLRAWGASAETAVIFRTRYRADLNTKVRVVYEGDGYDIVELKPIGRNRGWELRCKARPGS
ncbi:phage head closure protein [Ochrobactrum sp. CM-21-5]|nr:phage head closure protein [Ochrobactrum sp. CM-21-5]MBC2884331.1 phage head closure protein [Ochrobactrum sp. CM-21-5]